MTLKKSRGEGKAPYSRVKARVNSQVVGIPAVHAPPGGGGVHDRVEGPSDVGWRRELREREGPLPEGAEEPDGQFKAG